MICHNCLKDAYKLTAKRRVCAGCSAALEAAEWLEHAAYLTAKAAAKKEREAAEWKAHEEYIAQKQAAKRKRVEAEQAEYVRDAADKEAAKVFAIAAIAKAKFVRG